MLQNFINKHKITWSKVIGFILPVIVAFGVLGVNLSSIKSSIVLQAKNACVDARKSKELPDIVDQIKSGKHTLHDTKENSYSELENMGLLDLIRCFKEVLPTEE